MPQRLTDIDLGPKSPEVLRMIVEIPKNSTNDYEYDAALGIIRLDRPLYSPMHYPGATRVSMRSGMWRTFETIRVRKLSTSFKSTRN